MEQWGERFARWIVERPWRALGAVALVALGATPLALRLRLDTDPLALLPPRLDEAAAFARFARRFAEEQVLVVLVEQDAGDAAALTRFVDCYAAALAARPDVASVRARMSGATAALLRDHLLDLLVDEEQDVLAARAAPPALRRQARHLRALLAAPGGSALAPVVAADPLELLPLVARRLQAGLPVDPSSGYYRSGDGRALLLFVRPRFPPFDYARTRGLLDGAAALARDLGARPSGSRVDKATAAGDAPTVGFTGVYAFALGWRDLLERDMRLSTTLSAAAVLALFALLLGATRALPIVAVPLALALWLTAAVAALVFGRLNAVSLAFGTLLLSIGVDLPIQLYSRLREELERAPSPPAAIQRTVAALAAPSLLATLGPAAVFLACGRSAFPALAHLGVLAGLGLILNLAVTLLTLPALLAVIPARWWMPRMRARSSHTWLTAAARVAAHRPRRVLAVAALAALALAPAALRMRVDPHPLSVEPEELAAARVERSVERRFGGHDQLIILSDGDAEGALDASQRWLTRAEALRRAGLLERYRSVSALVPSPREVERRRARLAQLDPERIARDLEAALVDAGFARAPFAPFLRQLTRPPPPLTVEEAARRDADLGALVNAHVKDAAGRRTVATWLRPAPGRLDAAMATVARLARDAPGDGVLTGKPVVERALRDLLRRDARTLAATSIAVVALLLLAGYRRLRPALAVFLPLCFAWLLYAAALGLAGIPLDLFDLITVPLVIGYGIDDHVFLVHRHHEHPGRDATAALTSTGRAILVTSLATIAGFAALATARVSGLRLLGTTGALAVALCLVSAFAVLPALLSLLDSGRDP